MREEVIAGQITAEIAKAALPLDWIDFMSEQIEIDKTQESESLSAQLAKVRERIVEIDEKLKRLMTAYLDRVISIAEYSENKTALTEERLTLKGELTALEESQTGWFEPATRFINTLKQAVFLTSSGSKTRFSQKIRFEPHGEQQDASRRTLRTIKKP